MSAPNPGALPEGSKVKLSVVKGVRAGKSYSLKEGVTYVGRKGPHPVDVDLTEQENPGVAVAAGAQSLAGHDSAVEARTRSFFKAMEAKVAGAFSRAKVAGELAAGVEPASAARILVCFVEGLRVIGKTGPTRTTSQATADALLDRFIR